MVDVINEISARGFIDDKFVEDHIVIFGSEEGSWCECETLLY